MVIKGWKYSQREQPLYSVSDQVHCRISMDSVLKLAKEIRRTKPKRNFIPAVLGNAAGEVWTGFGSKVYVTLYNGEVIDILNRRVSGIATRPVNIGIDDDYPNLVQVLGFADVFDDDEALGHPVDHRATHEWQGHDQVSVSGYQFLPLLVAPASSDDFNVQVYRGFLSVPSGFVKVLSQTLNIASSQPSAGARYVLLQADDAGVVTAKDGTMVDAKELLSGDDIPLPDADRYPMWAVRVYDGQERLRCDRRINDFEADLRFGGYSLAGGGGFDLAATIHAASASAITDDDEMGFWESVADGLKKITWANIKSTLKTYFDALYAAIIHVHAATDITSGTLDGDRLPALSATKKGGVPATGTPSGKLLRDDSTWVAAGAGDVTGPSVSVDARISTFDGITGKAIKDSGYVVDDFAVASKGVTNGDSHDHVGGDGAQIAHTGLSSIGTNTHAQIDTHIGNTANPHSVTAAQILGAFVTETAFTPTIAGTTAAGTGTYTGQIGIYARIGNIVYFQLTLTWTALSGATGTLCINGLPITSANNGLYPPCVLNWTNITLAAVGNKLLAAVVPNTTRINLYEVASGAIAYLPIDTAGTISVSGWYFV
jgi:hypothetical protein